MISSATTAHRLARAVPKLKCQQCGEFASKVIRDMADDAGDCYARIRECLWCGYRYRTEERIAERRLKPR